MRDLKNFWLNKSTEVNSKYKLILQVNKDAEKVNRVVKKAAAKSSYAVSKNIIS